MKDEAKTKEQLINEVAELRRRVAELEHTDSERKTADTNNRLNEERFRRLIDSDIVGIALWHADGRLTGANRTFCDLVGYTTEEVRAGQARWVDLTPPELIERDLHCIEEINATGFCVPYEKEFIRRDGSLVPALIVGAMLGGLKDQCVVFAIDITKRKLLEEENQNKAALLENASDTILMLDPEGNFRYFNSALVRMTGYTREELLARKLHDIEPPEYAEKIKPNMSMLMDKGEALFESAYLRKDGTVLPIEVHALVSRIAGKTVIISSVRDITELKQAQENLKKALIEMEKRVKERTAELQSSNQALLKSEEKFRTLFESAMDGFFIIDMQGKIIDANRTAYERLGHTKEEILSMTLAELATEEFSGGVPERIEHVIQYGHDVFESGHRRKDGSTMPVEVNTRAMDLGGKKVLFSVVRDISERKWAEMKLEESEKLIRNILDTVDEGFVAIDRDFRILLANNAYCSQVGRTGRDVVGGHCYEVSHKSLLPCFEEGEDCAVRHVFETGEPYNVTHRHPDAKGDILYVETKAFPIKDRSGAITSAIETVQNITEKYLLEEERLKTQKLEAIGTLAGGIAHDFNNLLQGVLGYIYMAKIAHDDRERSLAMLDQAEKALHMSVTLTTQLLTFSKGGKPAKKKIYLESVIENSVRFALSGSSADYRIKLDTDLWHVEADEGQLGQVVQNIVLNADQAMPMGGTIAITAKNLHASKKLIPQLPEEGKYVEISVQDNGIGISDEHLSKIFDPYFTTKAKGSGLGLATCYSIIRNHGGVIHVASKVGRGTTFYVYLPAVEAVKEALQAPGPSPFVRKGKILLMDDEELIRNIAGDMIKALDHEVEFAEHGEEAVGKYKAAMESGNPFDVVILDLTIRGGMGGRETIERLLAVNPKIRAIVSSGYSGDAIVSDYNNYGFSACLTKPYKLQELSDTLNNMLGH